MSKLLKGSNSKFVVNLFKSFGVTLSLVAVSSCGDKGKDKNTVGSGEQGELNVETVFQDIDSLTKFAKENDFNVDGEKNQAVLNKVFEQGNSFKGKKKSDLIGALEKAGLKRNEQSNVQIQPGEQRQLENEVKVDDGVSVAVGDVVTAKEGDVLRKFYKLGEEIKGEISDEVRKNISEMIKLELNGNHLLVNEKEIIKDIKGSFDDYVKVVLIARRWNDNYKINLGLAGDVGNLVKVAALKDAPKEAFDSQIFVSKSGKDANKLIFKVGGEVEDDGVDVNGDVVKNISALWGLNSALFVNSIVVGNVKFSDWDFEGEKVRVKVFDCGEDVEVNFADVSAFSGFVNISSVKGNGNNIVFKIAEEDVNVAFAAGFDSFTKACSNLKSFFGDRSFLEEGGRVEVKGCAGAKVKIGDCTEIGLIGADGTVSDKWKNFFDGVGVLVEMGIAFVSELEIKDSEGSALGSAADRGIKVGEFAVGKEKVKKDDMNKIIGILNSWAVYCKKGECKGKFEASGSNVVFSEAKFVNVVKIGKDV